MDSFNNSCQAEEISWNFCLTVFFLPLYCWEVEALCSTIKIQQLSCQPVQNLYQKQPHWSPVPFVLGQWLGEPWRKWERTCHLLDPACYSVMSYQGFMMPHWNSIIVAARYQCAVPAETLHCWAEHCWFRSNSKGRSNVLWLLTGDVWFSDWL